MMLRTFGNPGATNLVRTLDQAFTPGGRGRILQRKRWNCLPGECHVLHPDELHDGAAGTDAGFGYRIVYLDPALIQEALGGRPLPFVRQPVIDPATLPKDCIGELWDFDDDLDDLACIDLVSTAAKILILCSSSPAETPRALALASLSRVHDLLGSDPTKRQSMDLLERVSGLDRWTLARQFRAAFGTSPSRFRTLRRLDRVRQLLTRSASLAAAAAGAGFADQSHMTRRFKSAYGLTPGEWVLALGANHLRQSESLGQPG
jgi:AraC-like DNA-binding protein